MKIEEIIELAKRHEKYNEARVNFEVSSLKEDNLLNQFIEKIEKSIKENKVGDKNEINSLLAYLVGVTSKYPDGKFNVPKRRVYARDGWPDIDIDVCYLHRNTLISYVKSRYGEHNVAPIGTVGKLEIKSAIHRAILVLDPCRVYNKENAYGKKLKRDPNFQLKQDICDTLPDVMKKPDGSLVKTLKEAYEFYPRFKEYMDKYKTVYKVARRLEGTIASTGVHAAGVILSPIPLERICPLHLSKKKIKNVSNTADASEKYEACTQYTMKDVEDIGLPKMDFLGLSTETSLARCFNTIKNSYNIELDRTKLPLDKKVFKMLSDMEGGACFQSESRGMQDAMHKINIDNLADIAVCVSIYRPGPMQYIDEYADRKHGRTKVSYPHPLYEKIASETYGIILFQEQSLRAFVDLAGLTENEGYKFVKFCAKKQPENAKKILELFLKGCVKNKIPESSAVIISKDLEKFSGYSFNLAHAAGYGLKCYSTGYLKYHFPVEFMESRLTVEYIRKSDKHMIDYCKEAERMGIKLQKCDLNKSTIEWQIIDKKTLLEPLIIKGIGISTAEEIMKNRPYDPKRLLYDFSVKAGRSNSTHISKKDVEYFYQHGLFRNEGTQEEVVQKFEESRAYGKSNRGRQVANMFAKS